MTPSTVVPTLAAPGVRNQPIGRFHHASSESWASFDVLADLGVARVSHGPGPYLAMMKKLEKLACAALRTEPPETVQG